MKKFILSSLIIGISLGYMPQAKTIGEGSALICSTLLSSGMAIGLLELQSGTLDKYPIILIGTGLLADCVLPKRISKLSRYQSLAEVMIGFSVGILLGCIGFALK